MRVEEPIIYAKPTSFWWAAASTFGLLRSGAAFDGRGVVRFSTDGYVLVWWFLIFTKSLLVALAVANYRRIAKLGEWRGVIAFVAFLFAGPMTLVAIVNFWMLMGGQM